MQALPRQVGGRCGCGGRLLWSGAGEPQHLGHQCELHAPGGQFRQALLQYCRGFRVGMADRNAEAFLPCACYGGLQALLDGCRIPLIVQENLSGQMGQAGLLGHVRGYRTLVGARVDKIQAPLQQHGHQPAHGLSAGGHFTAHVVVHAAHVGHAVQRRLQRPAKLLFRHCRVQGAGARGGAVE